MPGGLRLMKYTVIIKTEDWISNFDNLYDTLMELEEIQDVELLEVDR